MSEDSWFELPVMAVEDLVAPPPLFAVPAATQGVLEPYTSVTYGIPGAMWLVDEAQVMSGPHRHPDGRESYQVTPWAEYGASPQRDERNAEGEPTVSSVTVDTDDLWVYRPAPGRHTLDDLPPLPADWYDRLLPDLLLPPPARRPRPARELPSLTGRRVTVPGKLEGRWVSAVAVSEPVDEGDQIVVHVLRPEYYALAVYRHPRFDEGMVKTIPLHRIWTY